MVIVTGPLFLFFLRNKLVYRYRRALLQQVHEAAGEDIVNHREWQWRYDVFSSVSYYTMVYKFWRTFDSFYPNKSFIERDIT